MNRTVTTILMILSILVFAVSPVVAQTNTFTPQGGSTTWHLATNWSRDIPTAEEDVVIPAGETCIISTDDGVALTVTVASTATFGIEGFNTLVVHGADTDIALDIDGTLYLDGESDELRSTLLFRTPDDMSNHFVTITGCGTITAAGASGYGNGWIGKHGNSGILIAVLVDSDVTIEGSMHIRDLPIGNNGLIRVDGSDVMTIGRVTSPTVAIGGTGTFQVDDSADAVMTFDYVSLLGFQGTLDVTTGLMEGKNAGFTSMALGEVIVDGGTLTWDTDFNAGNTTTITIDNDGSMEIDGNLDIGNVTLTITDGTLDVVGTFDTDDSTITLRRRKSIIVSRWP